MINTLVPPSLGRDAARGPFRIHLREWECMPPVVGLRVMECPLGGLFKWKERDAVLHIGCPTCCLYILYFLCTVSYYFTPRCSFYYHFFILLNFSLSPVLFFFSVVSGVGVHIPACLFVSDWTKRNFFPTSKKYLRRRRRKGGREEKKTKPLQLFSSPCT